MKKPLFKYFLLVLITCCFLGQKGYGQNNNNEDFERATITSGSSPTTWTTTQSAPGFLTSTTSPLIGSSSLTFNKPGSGALIPTLSTNLVGQNFSFGTNNWEWVFLYKTPAAGVTPPPTNTMSTATNSWRLFVNANGTDPSAGGFIGYYVTQKGSNLNFYQYAYGSSESGNSGSYATTPNTTYVIRVVRETPSGGQYKWYVSPYTGVLYSTNTVGAAMYDQLGGNYKYTFLQASVSSATNNGIFKWDNLSMFKASLSVSGLNVPGTGVGGNGIAAYLTQKDVKKAIFGFKATATGVINITKYNFSWAIAGGASQNNDDYFTNPKLYTSSTDDVFTPSADDTPIGDVKLYSNFADITLNENLVNQEKNYFLVVEVKDYVSSTVATASIGLNTYTYTGNSPVTVTASIPGTSFTLPTTPTTWTGATSTAWALATNWDGGIPATTSSVIIPTGLSNYPVLVADQTINALSLNNANINLGNSFVLNVTSSILSDNSSITGTGTSYLNMTGGSGDRSISGTGLTVTNMKVDLPLSTNILQVYAPLNLSTLLTMTKGKLESNSKLTLKSTSNTTASIDQINTSNAEVVGNVNVERYFTGGELYSRGYRLISSPVSVSAASLILPNLTYINNQAHTTGTGAGFTTTGNPTLYLYRENMAPSYASFTSGNYRGVASINTTSTFTVDGDVGNYNIPAGNGLLFYFRGGPTTTTPTAFPPTIAQTATFTNTGYINQGNIVVKHWTTGTTGLLYTNNGTILNGPVRGYNLVGNPYPSSIDWETFATSGTTGIIGTNISNTIYIYNPKLKVYATYQKGVGGTSFNGSSGNIIPSGQGFFVVATGANPTLTFTETAKVSSNVTSTNLLMSTPDNDKPVALMSTGDAIELATSTAATTGPSTAQYVRLQLLLDANNADETLIAFKSTAKPQYLINEDAEYLRGNNVVSLATRSTDNKELAINQLAYPTKTFTIPLTVKVGATGIYKIKLTELKNVPAAYSIWLMDKWRKDSLDIRTNKVYTFNANKADTTSYGSKRFTLVIRPAKILALKLLTFTATAISLGAQLDWTTQNESTYTKFTIERSIDGKKWDIIGGLPSTGKGKYILVDRFPIVGKDYYRLKMDDINGAVTYSAVKTLTFAKQVNSTASNVSVYPNPATATVNVAVVAQAGAKSYAIRITGGNGMLLRTGTTTGTLWQGSVTSLLPGTYFVQVINNTTKAIVGNGKFIKN